MLATALVITALQRRNYSLKITSGPKFRGGRGGICPPCLMLDVATALTTTLFAAEQSEAVTLIAFAVEICVGILLFLDK